jgi:hypothetical protein
MPFPPEFGIQRHAQVFGCVPVWNNVVVDIDWLVLDTLIGEIDVQTFKQKHNTQNTTIND